MKRVSLLCFFLSLALLLPAQNLQLAHLFSDHMVLQQQASAPVWGWGEPGKVVSVQGS